jgi:hypothetical protein
MPKIDTKKYRENFEILLNPPKNGHWTDGIKPVEYIDWLTRLIDYPHRDDYGNGYNKIKWDK